LDFITQNNNTADFIYVSGLLSDLCGFELFYYLLGRHASDKDKAFIKKDLRELKII